MSKYPWGTLKNKARRDVWLKEQGLMRSFKEYENTAKEAGEANAEEWASDKIVEDWEAVQSEKETGADLPSRNDWYWAFRHYADKDVKRESAPSSFAWSLLTGAQNDVICWRNLQDRVAKDLFGGDVADDDDRAFIATGMPAALRERFSKVLGEAKRLFTGELPGVFGRAERS